MDPKDLTKLDLKEFKRIVAYARKSGAKRIKVGEIEVEFNDLAPFMAKGPASREESPPDKNTKPYGPPEPTVEDLNRWIHEGSDEPHEVQ